MSFEFRDATKLRIFNRQSGVCAHCGQCGIALITTSCRGNPA
jgi:hypothetical protein